jgi:general secretion pathway protein K
MRQTGAALIVALMTVAIATLLATRMLTMTDSAIGQVEGRAWLSQARELSRGGVDYARILLFEDGRRSAIDHRGEAWATPLPPVEAESGKISGRIDDLQGLFNLNSLIAPNKTSLARDALASYRRLLGNLGLDPALADHLTATLLPASTTQTVAQSRPLSDVSALREIPAYDDATLMRLRPYVIALPEQPPINVNTAPAHVLAALFPSLGLGEAEKLVLRRTQIPFRDTADFLAALSSPVATEASNIVFGVSSQYFLVRVNAMVGRSVVRQHALLYRQTTAQWPRVVWRQYL